MTDLWDPLTYETLMAGTVAHFETQELEPLTSNVVIGGPGVYALYYKGSTSEYQPIADGRHPIYVGKAVPPGARKGATQSSSWTHCESGSPGCEEGWCRECRGSGDTGEASRSRQIHWTGDQS